MLDVTLQKRVTPPKEQPKNKTYNWLYENSINMAKEPIDFKLIQEFPYNKWRTNSSLSNDVCSIFSVNEMNLNSHISDKMHYEYLFYSIKKGFKGKKKTEEQKKRDIELKKQYDKDQEIITLIQEYFDYGYNKACSVKTVLTEEQLSEMKQKLYKGGIEK